MSPPTPDETRGPLAGVRVLDLTRLLPGPMCSRYLVELGADVIKIEDVAVGDGARQLGASPGKVAAMFRWVNGGKRSCAIDLQDARGHAAFLALAKTCDVLIEGFRPGVMQKLGLDATAIHAVAPRVVYASITGYGQDGPRAHAAGHDINYLAYAGVLDQMGTAGGPPALCNLQIADLLGGAAMPAIAILAALLEAQRSGRGRAIDVAMSEAVLAHMVVPLQTLVRDGHTRPRGDDLLTGGVPAYAIYRTQDDRYLAVGALEPKFWQNLCTALGRADLEPHGLATDTEGARVQAILADIFARAPLSAWVDRLAGMDCCVSPVNTLAEALVDSQFQARNMVEHDAEGLRLGPPFRLSGGAVAGPDMAPALGEHSTDVLREAGLASDTIDALGQAGVIKRPARNQT